MNNANEQVLRVGICRLSSLGDMALSTVCLDLLAKLNRPVQVYWVGMPPHNEILVYSPVKLVPIAIDPQAKWRSMLGVVDELRHLHLLIDLQKNLRSQVLCKLLLWRWYVPSCSYDKERLRRWLLIFAARLRGRRRKAAADIVMPRSLQVERMQMALAGALGVGDMAARPRLVVSEIQERRGRLGVAVGASHAAKRMPQVLLAEILAQVVERQGDALTIFVLGNEGERGLGEAVCSRLATARVENLCGRLSVAELPRMLASMAVLLCNDSGLLHVAEAVGTPVVALFGPTVEAFGFKPWREDSRVFSSRLGCRPCSRHGEVECRYGDQKCFGLIDVDEVAGQVLQKLPSTP